MLKKFLIVTALPTVATLVVRELFGIAAAAATFALSLGVIVLYAQRIFVWIVYEADTRSWEEISRIRQRQWSTHQNCVPFRQKGESKNDEPPHRSLMG